MWSQHITNKCVRYLTKQSVLSTPSESADCRGLDIFNVWTTTAPPPRLYQWTKTHGKRRSSHPRTTVEKCHSEGPQKLGTELSAEEAEVAGRDRSVCPFGSIFPLSSLCRIAWSWLVRSGKLLDKLVINAIKPMSLWLVCKYYISYYLFRWMRSTHHSIKASISLELMIFTDMQMKHLGNLCISWMDLMTQITFLIVCCHWHSRCVVLTDRKRKMLFR